MTHEFKDIVRSYKKAKEQGIPSVLATVVDLDGSSYRKPGVKMLILENGNMVGAVSGGCVEKDIVRQSKQVFESGDPIIMTYDGRYRLGCEGVLYILIERFDPGEVFISAFDKCLKGREYFDMVSYYKKEEGSFDGIGSYLKLGDEVFTLSGAENQFGKQEEALLVLKESLPPCFKLMIFGAEHDAVQLCKIASLNGWEVTIVTGPLEAKTIENFPGASALYSVSPDTLELKSIDAETAIVLMTHNFANDLKFLIELKESHPAYIGLLGPAHRREKLFAQLLEYCPEVNESFIGKINGPAGLNIGAETPQEIAISILSEILSVVRKKTPILLKEKDGGIHA